MSASGGRKSTSSPSTQSQVSRGALAMVRANRLRREKRMTIWIARLGAQACFHRLRGGASRCREHDVRMVSVLSMPRTGSSLAKRYLGGFSQVDIAPLQRFEESLSQARTATAGRVVLDKKTDNIKRLHEIAPQAGCEVAFVCLIRDPRDELVSLGEIDRHRPVPRDARFWPYWTHRYARALTVLRHLGILGVPVALLRYEDLAVRPVAVKQQFAEWVGLDVESVDDAYEGMVGDQIIQSREDWKVHQQSRVSAASVGRWRHADAEIAQAIMALSRYAPARRLMKRLGYDPATTIGAYESEITDSAADAHECDSDDYGVLEPRKFPHITLLTGTHTPAPSSR